MKDWTEDFAHENGNYRNTCISCKETFSGHKRRVICKECFESEEVPVTEFTRWFQQSGIDGLTGNEFKFANALFYLPEMELIGGFTKIFESIRTWKRSKT